MANTRNTEVQFNEALKAALAETKRQSPRVQKLAKSLYDHGTKHGFAEVTAAVGSALLAGAAAHMATAEENARRQGVDDGPDVGDHVADANRLLGIYEQICAANRVASLGS